MTLQVEEITNFKTGIDVSLDPILSPIDSFINLRNGFVYRGVLRSRAGFRHFADGASSSTRLVSRVSNEITNESVDTGDGVTDYTFSLANTQIERSTITINAPVELLTVTLTYDPTDGTTNATGNTGGGTNSINYQTGAVSVSFSGVIGGGNAINATYNYHPDLAIMGIHEYVRTSAVRDLVVLDEDFPYIYDRTNDDFDRISFAGSATDFTGLTDNFFTFQNWRLNSRGAVPGVPDPLALSDLLFFTNNVDEPYVYDGTDVKVISDLPEFRAPSEGSLDKALHVISYGERLLWLRPTLGGEEFSQGVLWGPINDTTGLALDYQGTGSGLSSAVTDSALTGYKFVRDTLIVWFETDVYALELTDDAFQPFKWTKIEDERGVEPTHGAVGYLGKTESPGRLGIMQTNARRVSRVDNKIPNFTRDNIDSTLITHIFGEEMEEDSQFWWTYPDALSTDVSTANKILVKNFEENNYAIFDIKTSVLNKTIIGQGTTWDNLPDVFGNPDPDDGDVGDFEGPVATVIWNRWGYLGENYRTLLGDHNGFVWVTGDSFSDGNAVISPNLSGGSAITLGSTTTVQTEYNNFQVDDVVEFRNVNGTTELNGLRGTITSVTNPSEFVVDIDSTDFTAWTSGGEVIKPINFEAEFVPFNPFRSQGKTCHLVRMDFLITSGTGEYTIDFFENRLNQDWTSPIDRSYTFSSGDVENLDRWFGIVVDNVADFHRWKITQKQANERVAIKSVRIYFKDGGDSNV